MATFQQEVGNPTDLFFFFFGTGSSKFCISILRSGSGSEVQDFITILHAIFEILSKTKHGYEMFSKYYQNTDISSTMLTCYIGK